METVNLLLNLVGLGLWAGAFVFPRYAVRLSRPSTLLSTLRSESPEAPGRQVLAGSLAALLVLRAAAYWNFSVAGSPWPNVDFGVLGVGFNPDSFVQMLVYSVSSFAVFLFLYYLCVLGLSLSFRATGRADSVEKFVNQQLGTAAFWPGGWKVFLSFVAGAGLWLAVGSLEREALPAKWSFSVLLMQSPFVAASLWLRFLLVMIAVLVLHFINSYVYLGRHMVWPFIDRTAKVYLSPFRVFPLLLGRFDFAPILGILALWLLYHFGDGGLRWAVERLP